MQTIHDADPGIAGPQEALTPEPGARRSGQWGAAAGWAAAGFVAGAVVWHFVGFWSFVSYAVLGGDHRVEAAARQAAPRACATLALDRATGRTKLLGCEDVAYSPPPAVRSGPADRGDPLRPMTQ